MNTIKGAIIGDIVGSVFEGTVWSGDRFDEAYSESFSYRIPELRAKEEDIIGKKAIDFPLFIDDSKFTDDTVLTAAMMQALSSTEKFIKLPIITKLSIKLFYSQYKEVGYGAMFKSWAQEMDLSINGQSFGNGAAMRISPVVQKALCENYSVQDLLKMVDITSRITHKNKKSLEGAKIIALMAFVSSRFPEHDKNKIINDVLEYFKLPIQDEMPSLFEYRIENQKFTSSAEKTVPMAIAAFRQGTGFEDTIRKAVSVGGDTDTIAAMAGTIAGAYYGVPDDIWNTATNYLDGTISDQFSIFEMNYGF